MGKNNLLQLGRCLLLRSGSGQRCGGSRDIGSPPTARVCARGHGEGPPEGTARPGAGQHRSLLCAHPHQQSYVPAQAGNAGGALGVRAGDLRPQLEQKTQASAVQSCS